MLRGVDSFGLVQVGLRCWKGSLALVAPPSVAFDRCFPCLARLLFLGTPLAVLMFLGEVGELGFSTSWMADSVLNSDVVKRSAGTVYALSPSRMLSVLAAGWGKALACWKNAIPRTIW